MIAGDFALEEEPAREYDPPLPLADMSGDQKREFWSCLALRHSPGLGARKRARLLNHFGSAGAALENVDKWDKSSIPENIQENVKREIWLEEATAEWKKALKLDASILLWTSRAYPRLLLEICDPPLFLYCRGDIALLQSPAIAIVGSRNASAHSLNVAANFGKTLSACGIVVVSGLATGIDRAAQLAALANIGKSIGVLGTGIDRVYPWGNRDLFRKMERMGLLLSEFAPGAPPIGYNFPVRNRIISGLSLGVVVVEAASKSGSLVTARNALEQNREVFAVPGAAMDAHATGCQNLVRQGATPVFCVDDVLRNMEGILKFCVLNAPQATSRPEIPKAPVAARKKRANERNGPLATPLPPEPLMPCSENCEAAEKLLSGDKSAKITQCLRNQGSLQIDALATALDLQPSELNVLLLGLEMAGKVKRLPGARFEAT